MATTYTTRVSKRAERKYRDHGEVVKLAAQICGRSESMIYQVRNGKKKSAIVLRAIHEAERILRERAA